VDVIGKDLLQEAQKKHTKAKKAIDRWLRLAEACKAKHAMELKKTFGDLDPVPPQTVFDIMGNHYRLIAEIDYEIQVIVVTYFLTHKEYDKNKWKRG